MLWFILAKHVVFEDDFEDDGAAGFIFALEVKTR
jgi:hypothetical protein